MSNAIRQIHTDALPMPTRRTRTIQEAAILLGVGLSTAYAMVKEGTFPCKVIDMGGRIVVPIHALEELLGPLPETRPITQAEAKSLSDYPVESNNKW